VTFQNGVLSITIGKYGTSSKNTFSFTAGAIENPVINEQLVEILEGTKSAFNRRKLRYSKT
jgi:hypothetical protein